jgi:DNA-binding NarL/FixJ family response regulator
MEQMLDDATPSGRGTPLRLMIVDRPLLFRECLASVLIADGHFDVVDRANDMGDALGRLGERTADVLLVVQNGDGDGIVSQTREALARFPSLRILILAEEDASGLAVECLKAGAGGILNRDQSVSDLRCAIERVASGERVCSPRVAHALFTHLGDLGRERRRSERLDSLDLTARELEILRLISDGMNNQQIASALNLSVFTVKNHVHKILDTLGVHSRWGAVKHASAKGWLEEPRRGIGS